MTMFPAIRALRHVAIRVTDLDACTAFYGGPWGLDPVATEDGVAYFRATGPEHHVLELHASDENGLHHLAFAVATPAEVDDAAGAIGSLGGTLIDEPARASHPGGGYAMRFTDPEGRLVEVSAEVSAVPARPEVLDVPEKLAHVVLNTVDIDAACGFYTGALGLRVSDWSEHQMVFLRCGVDHHCIAFNQASWASLNHVAYEVPTLDRFMRCIGRLRQAGQSPAWGPGRHGPGNTAFSYFVDPVGLVPEVTAEVAQVDEATWVPRVWPRIPELSDLWGTAGAPSAEVRSHMAGTPDAGWATVA